MTSMPDDLCRPAVGCCVPSQIQQSLARHELAAAKSCSRLSASHFLSSYHLPSHHLELDAPVKKNTKLYTTHDIHYATEANIIWYFIQSRIHVAQQINQKCHIQNTENQKSTKPENKDPPLKQQQQLFTAIT